MRPVAAYAVGVLALVAIAPVLRPSPFALTDHTVFVEAGRLVLEGRSPYDPLAWAEVATRTGSPHIAMLNATTGVWPHPPWLAFAFVPFALLPPDLAPWALHAMLLLSGIAGAVLLVERLRWTGPTPHVLALAIALTFQPLVIGIRWGQLGPFLLLGFALLTIGLERRRTAPIVAAALLLALKPHVLVLLAAVAAVVVMRRVPRAVLPTALALAVGCGIPTLANGQAWLAAAGQGYAARIDAIAAYATTYALAIDLWPAAWPLAAAAGISLALAACGYAVRIAPPDARSDWLLAAAIVASLVVAPYLWPTDQALLLAVVLLALCAAQGAPAKVRGAHLTLTVMALGLAPWALFLISAMQPTQALEAIVPLAAALVLAQSARLVRGADGRTAL